MDAREVLARKILRDENIVRLHHLRRLGVDPYADDPWAAGGPEMHDAYLRAADAIIEELEEGGFTIVRELLALGTVAIALWALVLVLWGLILMH